MRRQIARPAKQLLTLGREDPSAPDMVKELQAQLELEFVDLPGASRLGEVQPQSRPRHGAQPSRMAIPL